ncbi:SDR family NAD(P)-dependent oxidoreductase [Streptomyces ipomoeae]|uniref:SDR family NAD(P)-dependent oxidoreductase n=1 Tax=Streptomyces ipomoeae TaxID=103232 RepID=UPI0029B705E4|nr:SDR family NAD(P)-dependent oxidoreductase [Streptomyces ipomoeae]MDX2823084.1 SDR family NAD(P)-dependent oxidoreductase [Streptomyces ipomoeae]MDX2873545.1 SDR family NAD(P)-dependent oxidoreductase [Streptomyces ipomoeae]
MTIRTALVTGGAGGLGAAGAERLRADGLKVTTLDLTGADVCVDITDEEALRQAAGAVGPVDVLINSAGIVGPDKPLLDTTTEEWRRVLDVNVLGTANTMRVVVPGMRDRGWGRVVNFAGMAGKDGNPNLSVCSASKAAVIALTKSAGKELATGGVLVNVITPAVVATAMNASTAPDVLDRLTSLIPMQRIGRPEEVAELVAFLSSDRVSFSTGAVYDISGGRATYWRPRVAGGSSQGDPCLVREGPAQRLVVRAPARSACPRQCRLSTDDTRSVTMTFSEARRRPGP